MEAFFFVILRHNLDYYGHKTLFDGCGWLSGNDRACDMHKSD